jgi:hypothetical protein
MGLWDNVVTLATVMLLKKVFHFCTLLCGNSETKGSSPIHYFYVHTCTSMKHSKTDLLALIFAASIIKQILLCNTFKQKYISYVGTISDFSVTFDDNFVVLFLSV